MKHAIIFVFVVAMFTNCSVFQNRVYGNAPELSTKQLVDWKNKCGQWYSKTTSNDNEIREELSTIYEDGTFSILFKETNKDGSVKFHKELGEWGISGNIYFTIIKSVIENGVQEEVDPLSPYYRDAYVIKNLTDKKCTYQHITTKDTYTETKVDKKFELK